ncbi:MAG: N-formylglutamate amidohydrolase [Pseudomonadota bacterium]
MSNPADIEALSATVLEEAAARSAPFRLREPAALSSGVVFSSPHSGRVYFRELVAASRLSLHALRASEDAYVDHLFNGATDHGAPFLAAVAPRAYIDLNRAPGDLDPSLVDGAEARPANARVVAGLGVVPRIVAEGVSIYDGKISLGEARDRVAYWHAPYHQKLMDLLLRARRRFGRALLIDCHSMPTGASNPGARRLHAPVDVVLGDRFGMAADGALMDVIEAAFVDAGFRVARNAPFAGGYITERYGRPAAGVSAIQIELDRGLYLDQSFLEPTAEFGALRVALAGVVGRICDLVRDADPRATALAAE